MMLCIVGYEKARAAVAAYYTRPEAPLTAKVNNSTNPHYASSPCLVTSLVFSKHILRTRLRMIIGNIPRVFTL